MSGAPAQSSARPSRTARVAGRLLRWSGRALWTLGVQLFIVLSLALLWLSLSASAPAWLWTQLAPELPALRMTGLTGRFATGLAVAELRWRDDVRDLTLRDVRLRWRVSDLLQGRVSLDALSVRELRLRQRRDTPAQPLVPPAIRLPVAWAAPDLRVDRLVWQPFAGDTVVLHDIRAAGEGAGERITLQRLHLRHALGELDADGHADMRGDWPLALTLRLKAASAAWPRQRVDVSGDLSGLRLRASGPAAYPLRLDATVDVRPLAPTLRGRLEWPRWSPPGQQDWRLEQGGLSFQGSTAAGVATLALVATPRAGGALPWPSGWPRRATLGGPLSWRATDTGANLKLDWQGRFGAMPWLVKGALDSARLRATRFDMQLADARLSAAGWPDAAGLQAMLTVPHLQRFQSALTGSATLDARWQGAPERGRGRISLKAGALRQRGSPLADSVQVTADGSLASQTWRINVRRDDLDASLDLQGGIDRQRRIWRGSLRQGQVTTGGGGRWRLRAPAALQLAMHGHRLEEQCWQQQPWLLCAQAELLPARWSARLRADAGGHGRLLANLRRDPRRADPPLDADLMLERLDLAHLPVSLPAGLALQGRARARARLSGSLAAPSLVGDFQVEQAALQMPAHGLDWHSLAVNGRLLGDRADWRGQFSDAAGGSANLVGQARWRPALSIRTHVDGRDLRVIHAPWVTARITPTLDFSLDQGRAALRGRVLVPEAMIRLRQPEAGAPVTSEDVRIISDRDGRVPAAIAQGGGLPLDLALEVQLGDKVKLAGLGLTSRLLGQLALRQKPGQALAAHGELRLSDDAIYEAYGQRLQIRNGRFLFAGPPTRPDVQAEAIRVVNAVTVGVRLSGRAPTPQATLFSSTAMAQEEILALLVLGRSLESSTGMPTAAERQALALGAALKLGGRTGAFDRLGQRLGIQNLSLGTQGERDKTQVAVSGYVRPDLHVSVGMGLFAPTQSLKVRYQLNRRLSLEAVTSLESAITLFYSWRF